MVTTILELFDQERQTLIYPGVTRFVDVGVIRDVTNDGKSCDVVYSRCSEVDLDGVIESQIQTARQQGYAMEWKVYGHDQPLCLGDRLARAGFEADDRESFMVLPATTVALQRFESGSGVVRRITRREDLADYRIVFEEVSGENCDQRIDQYGTMLENYPDTLSVYVAYFEGEPAACGRIYFHENSQFAYIFGGQTRERFRNRGLFTQVVAARIREAIDRGVEYVCVDAAPTSEPILRKRGFEILTYTQPYYFHG